MLSIVIGGILGIVIGIFTVCMLIRFVNNKKRKKLHTMDVILVVIAIFLLLFTVSMLWLYRQTGGIPDVLCTCVFTMCAGECGIMGMIQTTKQKQKDRQYVLEDRKYEEKKRKSEQSGNRVDGE